VAAQILSAENLLQAFSAAYVTTGLERARREALVRSDGGYDLLMQIHVFPRVHDFEQRCAEYEAMLTRMHEVELADQAMHTELFDFRKAQLLSGEPLLSGRAGAKKKKESRAAEQEIELRLRKARQELKHVYRDFERLKHNVHVAHSAIYSQRLTGEVLAEADTTVAVRLFRCSADGCGGNYRSNDGICMVCKLKHCKRCAATVAEAAEGVPAHVCNPDDVATMKEIAHSTRECPSCHASIQRASGCDQMMCVACHCVFDWRTGQESRGLIHNPHFHALGQEERQRILDEREQRGLVSTREERFIAGAGPRRAVPACDPNAEIDPECEPFESRAFVLVRLL